MTDTTASPLPVAARCRRALVRRGKRAGLALGFLVVFGAGVGVDRTLLGSGEGAGAATTLSDSPAFAVFEETWNLIQTEYVATDEIDDTALLHGAAQGMVEALNDTGHSRFLNPGEADEYEAAIRGEYVGIGIRLDIADDLPVVAEAIPGAPAAGAGIRSGDVILGVDNVGTLGLDREAVSDLLRGEPGTEVTLTLRRATDGQRYRVTLVRATLTERPVTWTLLPDGVAHIRLSEFTLGATGAMTEAIEAARGQGATGIVLDLRDNPGGLVDEALGVFGQFVPKGTVLYQQQDRGREPYPVATSDAGIAQDLPLTVLVNGGSASAAEIVGGALRDSGRAMLLGETTFGTGTVLIPFELADDSVALLGTSLWLTANGERAWRIGVEPDRQVALPPDVYPARPTDDEDRVVSVAELASSEDRQLQSAHRAVVRLVDAEPDA